MSSVVVKFWPLDRSTSWFINIQGINGSVRKPALVQDTYYMVEKTYHKAPYLGAFGAYLLPNWPIYGSKVFPYIIVFGRIPRQKWNFEVPKCCSKTKTKITFISHWRLEGGWRWNLSKLVLAHSWAGNIAGFIIKVWNEKLFSSLVCRG